MRNTLEFDGLEISFGERRILSSVYMKCEVGEVVGILGRNGSGKSTLMKIVFGSLRSYYQSIRINGKSLPGNRINQRLIGYLPQDELIPQSMKVHEALDLYKIDVEQLVEAVHELRNVLNLRPGELSGGLRRIVEVALILKTKNQFCILDEPFSGVMPLHIEKIKQLISEEKRNKGIIITDHLYRDVLSIADRLYILNNGTSYPVKSEDDLLKRGYIAHL